MGSVDQRVLKWICLLLCVCLTVTLVFWIHECRHDCGGEDCVICQAMLLLRKKLLSVDVCLLLLGWMIPVIPLTGPVKDTPIFPSCDTPVSRKVKLTI